jgi:hypothetical protein
MFSTFVLRLAAVAGGDEKMKSPTAQMPNVMGKFMKRQPNGNRQTRKPPEDSFDSP